MHSTLKRGNENKHTTWRNKTLAYIKISQHAGKIMKDEYFTTIYMKLSQHAEIITVVTEIKQEDRGQVAGSHLPTRSPLRLA